MRASPVRLSPPAVILWSLSAGWLSACSVMSHLPTAHPPLVASLSELVPHADRDHFVYVFERVVEGRRIGDGIQVEHVSAADASGEFEVALSENGMGAGRVRIRDTGSAIVLIGEDDLGRDLRLTYDPPLIYLQAPLVTTEQRCVSTATVTRLSDGQPVGALQVTQVVQVSAAPPVHSPLGDFERPVRVRSVRTLQSPEGTVQMDTTMLLAPGVGELRSDGAVAGAPTLHRELACAIISGRRVGDCRELKGRLEELKRAGPTDLQ